MKITPVGAQAPAQAQSASASDARARAIAMLTGAAPQVNQNNVAAEEAAAVQPPTQEAAAPTEEAPATQEAEGQPNTSEPEAKQDPLSKQYAILARKEKQLRAQIQQQKAALQAEKAAIDKVKAEYAAKDAEYASKYISKDRLTQDPFGVLTEQGMSYDDLTNRLLNQTKADPAVLAQFEKMQAKIDALEAAQGKSQKDYQDQQQQQYTQAVAQIRSEAKQLVAITPDFETIRETNSVDDVVELIERTFKAEGKLLSVDEAARAVEEYLTEEAIKIAKLKKIQQRLQPTAQAPKQTPAQPAVGTQKQPLKTLTNASGSTRPLSAKERAILAFKGELKN